MNSPSPLLPQGAIPPQNKSRSGRVLAIAAIVVVCHVGGLAVILMQGCQKDALKTASGGETNSTALSLPTIDTNVSPYYTAASNLPPVSVATNPVAVTTAAPTPPATVATQPASGLMEPPTGAAPATGQASDYKVVRGDTLAGIAKKNHVTISAIQAANGNIDPKKLMPGQTLKVPAPAPAAPSTVSTAGAAATGTPPPVAHAAPGAVGAGSYTVKPGDNLTKIAKAHGITVNQLRAANGIKTTQVQAGKVLKIPAKTTAAAPSGATAAH